MASKERKAKNGLLPFGMYVPFDIASRFGALSVFCACALTATCTSICHADWPQFRGPAAAVVSAEIAKTIPTDFGGPTNKNILWKSAIPLPGESSPILIGKQVILTGATLEKRTVYSLDADTGKIQWQTDISAGGKILDEFEPMPDTGYAAPTAVSDGKSVVVAFANGDIAGLDLAGKILWTKNLGETKSAYGYAASPALDGANAIIQFDMGNAAKDNLSRILSVEMATGKVNWETPRPVPNSWASPLVVKQGDARLVVTAGEPFAIAYDAATGKEVWRLRCLGTDTASTPASANGLAFVSAFRFDLTAIPLDSKGELPKSKRKWKSDDVEMPECASPVANEKFVFTAADNGLLACFDIHTGETLWAEEIHAAGDKKLPTAFRSSPMLVGEQLWIFDRDGTLHRFEAAKEFKKLGTATLGEKTDPQPAFAPNRMYVRTKENLVCIGTK